MSPLPTGGGEVVPLVTAAPSRRRFLAHLVRLGRPKYLLYSWLLYTLGVAGAAFLGQTPGPGTYLHGLLFVWCTHLMTHYCNEYFDMAADAANPSPTQWTGGSRVLVEGKLKPEVSLGASFVLLFFCLGLVPSMPRSGQYVALAALALAWFYTAPPFRFNYRGMGELVVTTVLNGCFPMVGYVLAAGETGLLPALLLLPAFLIQFVRMTIMNLLDYEGDRRVGKRTLVVQLGPQRILHLHALGQALAYVLLVPAALLWGLPGPVALCVAATSPLALWQVVRLYRGAHLDVRTRNSVVFWASTHCSLVVAAAYVGLLLHAFLEVAFLSQEDPGHFSRLFLVPLAFYSAILLRQIQTNLAQPPQPAPLEMPVLEEEEPSLARASG